MSQLEAKRADLLAETMAATRSGDMDRAMSLAEKALQGGAQHPLFYKLRAARRESQRRLPQAAADFRAALAQAPGDIGALNGLGLCLARLGQTADALAAFDKVLRAEPGFAPTHYNRGWTLETLGDVSGAEQAYARAAQCDLAHAPARANLAILAARRGDLVDARARAEQALRLDPSHPVAHMALAMAELDEGRLFDAQQRLESLLADARLPLHERSTALGMLGDALDRRDRPAEAFQSYTAANAGFEQLYGSHAGGSDAHSFASRLRTAFDDIPAHQWRDITERPFSASSPVGEHIFILGFPRSGTTLLGQVLASHPDMVTLDEQETLAAPARAFLGSPGGIDRLAALSGEELEHWRRIYWRRVSENGIQLQDRVFIDKLPMNTLGLPLIAKLFPRAKIIFVHRDPRDVVLSCFRHRFVMSAMAWEFLDLERTARYYDAVMGLAETCIARLPLDVRLQRHEDLVTDFDQQTAALRDFIGVRRSDAMANFAVTARSASIATPSAAQIARGLSPGGLGQWRRFKEELAPIAAMLAPWVRRFGYPDE